MTLRGKKVTHIMYMYTDDHATFYTQPIRNQNILTNVDDVTMKLSNMLMGHTKAGNSYFSLGLSTAVCSF